MRGWIWDGFAGRDAHSQVSNPGAELFVSRRNNKTGGFMIFFADFHVGFYLTLIVYNNVHNFLKNYLQQFFLNRESFVSGTLCSGEAL